MDNNIDIIQKAIEIESIIEIGQEISTELELVSNVLRSHFDNLEYFIDNKDHINDPINKDLINYIKNSIRESKLHISKFESELEEISNYNREDDILKINSKVIDKLQFSKNINIFLRFELEECILKMEVIKDIIEDITNNLNKQKTDRLLGSKMVM